VPIPSSVFTSGGQMQFEGPCVFATKSHARAPVRLGPVTAKNVPIAFTSGAAIFSRFANWLLVPSWVEREGMG
jgi:hypothetical protein